jgi:hypothetical protein
MRLPRRSVGLLVAVVLGAAALALVSRVPWAGAGASAPAVPTEDAADALMQRLMRRGTVAPPTAAEDNQVVVAVPLDPVGAPGGPEGADADDAQPPLPRALEVVRLDPVLAPRGELHTGCVEKPNGACALCGAPCTGVRPITLVPVAAISAVFGVKKKGPIVSLLLAVGRWRYNTTDLAITPDPIIAVAVEAELTVTNADTGALLRQLTLASVGEHDTSRYDYEPNTHGAAVVELPLPRGLFNAALAATARLTATLSLKVTCTQTLSVAVPPAPPSTASPRMAQLEVVVSSVVGGGVRVDLPFGHTPASLAALVGGLPTAPLMRPRLAACYGPLFTFGQRPSDFFSYLIEYVEYHRHVGLAHQTFYLWSPGTSRELDAFKALYAHDGALVSIVHYDRVTPMVDAYNFAQRMIIDDCLARHKSDPQLVLVADVDEWVWPSRTATIPEALRTLIRAHTDTHATATHYQFFVMEDYVHEAHVCAQADPAETVEEAAARLVRERPLLLSRAPYFYTNCHLGGARRKTVSLTRLVAAAEEHEPLGGEQSPTSMTAASGLVKIHTRALPHSQPPPVCTMWESTWKAETAKLGASLDCPVLTTVQVPWLAEGYIAALQDTVQRQRARYARLLASAEG